MISSEKGDVNFMRIKMKFHAGNMKTWLLTLLGVLTILCVQVRPAGAAGLNDVRIGEYRIFTRIVFEFDGPVRFQDPVIEDKGRFSIVFFDSVAKEVLPSLKLRERTGQIDAVEFTRQGPHLTSAISLHSSDFKLKTFYLFSPDRVVVDIYWVNGEQITFAPGKLSPSTLAAPQTENRTFSPSSEDSRLQIFLLLVLVVLSVITIIIMALLSFILLQRRRSTEPVDATYFSGSPGRKEDAVSSIDSKIKEEIKRYDQS